MNTMEELGVEVLSLDFNRVVADEAAIQQINPQRFEMAMLSAIVHMDNAKEVIVAYKDFAPDAFWIRGHFPKMPVLPGVLMCEAAAQLCNYFSVKLECVSPDRLVGLGGIEDARFRGMVKPGQRLIVTAKAQRLSRRMTKFATHGYTIVNGQLEDIFEAVIIGVVLGKTEDLTRA
ncbi:MAG: 3-hydroxyacyl-ACP dehydratase FabZ family protein [Gemmataceae bacterium]